MSLITLCYYGKGKSLKLLEFIESSVAGMISALFASQTVMLLQKVQSKSSRGGQV